MSSFDLKYPDLFSNINNVNYKPSETDPTAEEIKSSINSVFSFIGTEDHKKSLDDIKDQKDGVNRTYKRAEKLFEKAEQNAEDVLELIEKLEAESEEAQEYNERLQEQQEIIATNLEIIKDTKKTPPISNTLSVNDDIVSNGTTFNIIANIVPTKAPNINPATAPSTLFFGLILTHKRCLPNSIPKQ